MALTDIMILIAQGVLLFGTCFGFIQYFQLIFE